MVSSLVRRYAQAKAEGGIELSYREEMPDTLDELHVAMEVIDGRNDREATVIRNRHLFEGGGRDQLPLLPFDIPESECQYRIEAWLSPAMHHLEAEAEMRGRNIDPLNPPLEELVCSPIMRDIISWSDFHSSVYKVKRTPSGGLVHPPGGIARGRIAMESIRRTTGDDDSITMDLDLSGRRLHSRRTVIMGRNTIRIVDVDAGISEITVTGVTVPESTLANAIGRKIGELLTHPMLNMAKGMEIKEARTFNEDSGSYLVILAKGDQVPAHPMVNFP